MKEKFFIMVACVFLWIGFVCAISFMEAWLKFRAPGVTIPVGLSIGKIVFKVLNRVEWIFAVVIVAIIIFNQGEVMMSSKIWCGIAIVVLIIQTFWLLPALDHRADAYIKGESFTSSFLHVYFVAGEVIKVVSLFFLGTGIFKSFFL